MTIKKIHTLFDHRRRSFPGYTIQSFLHFFFFLLNFALVGCGHLKTTSSTSPSYTDPAAAYIESCRKQFEKAQQIFRTTEQSEFSPPADILTAINRLDILTYEPTGLASLYSNVHPNEFVRAAAEICEQKFTALTNDIRLSVPLYKKLIAVDPANLSPLDRYFLQRTRQLFELAGVGLDEESRRRISQLNDEILKIGQEFAANIRNDVRLLDMVYEDLQGLPEDYIVRLAFNTRAMIVTTNGPDYYPFMQYASNDAARKRMYTAFRQRGYPANKEVLHRLLQKRYELARLLGYQHFGDYITVDKMIGSAANAAAFIERIDQIAKPRSDQDYAVLLERLRKIDPAATEVGDWQKTYLENLVRHEAYAIDSQEVRQYFSYQKVKQGIFDLVEDLFDVTIKPWKTPVWHYSVEAYEIRKGETLIGQFFLDMHPRRNKYQHAAHFSIREGVKGVQTPLAALVCNFPGGGDGAPDLLEHDQVETFLHEFGHLLHSMFGGNQPWMNLSGTNTQHDFVEAPSQMLEEWVWDAETLKSFATNSEGEVIPDALIEKMNAARKFGRGIFVRHQMFYAALSLNYYNRDPADVDVDRMMVELQERYSPFAYVDDTYLYANFGHLDGYSALYYTYMWSLVIAADMFSEFQTHGLRNKVVAARYRDKVLSPGGSKPAAELVEDFLGRPFNFQAFADSLKDDLKH